MKFPLAGGAGAVAGGGTFSIDRSSKAKSRMFVL
jgi:hypothetical protein